MPDEAFAAISGDDKGLGARWRKTNKQDRADHATGQLQVASAIQQKLVGMLTKWNTLSALPEETPAEIDAKKESFLAFEQGSEAFQLAQIAAIPIAQFYIPKRPENDSRLITDAQFRRYWTSGLVPQGEATAMALATAIEKRFFHWFLEFPDIIARGGFDCILGNPPYLGGQALSGTYGHAFCGYVKWEYAPTGLSDLVVYFVRRIFDLLKNGGFTAFITTNSIKDGDVRKDSLEQVVAQGSQINMAVRGIKWPGRANLVVSLVGIHKGAWKGKRSLDGIDVAAINPFFEDAENSAVPCTLAENQETMFMGTIWLGEGFLLSRSDAEQLRTCGAFPSSVRPLLNGQEVNSSPDQEPDRWIINLEKYDSLVEAETVESALVERLRQLVLPERLSQKNERAKRYWWRYYRYNELCYSKLELLGRAFVAARTTKHLAFSSTRSGRMFTDALYVFTTDRWDLFAVVQSTLHEVWARKYSGALKQDLRYSPSHCFDTFAFPEGLWKTTNPALADLGEGYHEHRKSLMLSLWLGLTDIYNLFHARDLEADLKKHFAARAKRDPQRLDIPVVHRAHTLAFTYEEALDGVLELRGLHVQLDTTVRDAYGWQNLGLDHDFYEVDTLAENDRVRYTISPTARKEVLRRLLALNHARAEAEKVEAKPRTQKRGKKALLPDDEPIEMFTEDSFGRPVASRPRGF